LSYNHEFRKYFKLVYRKNVVMATLTTVINVSPIQLHALLGVGNFTKVVRVCADCLWSGPRLFENHWSRSCLKAKYGWISEEVVVKWSVTMLQMWSLY
jgi:hypothetical protein